MPPKKTSTPKAPRASKATASSPKASSPKKVKRAGTMAETAADGKAFLKKADKTAKAKAKAAHPHPAHKVMAAEAITALKVGRKGVSAQAMSKYIIGTYHIDPGHHLRLALKNGVATGYFEKVTQGTYKLGPEAKKKTKKAAPKKTATAGAKKTAPAKKAGSGTKKAAPKKAATAGAKKAGAKKATPKKAAATKKSPAKKAASPKASPKKVKRAGTMAETAAEGEKFLKKNSSKGKRAGSKK
eukprot:CAMPEP_0201521290 /NCGR_PEP_ID=MMETSP0161_2-20130828/14333_1 /ASSEMBLY_ACC=CAM_ASM_000251 /TAXON_ID=180227 /ORGANISM="Neoparamoeba aestuarina, Strain SoJaBio B1-5/56/2" /LENGTH=241 /DNA_ID=CAMNT_0047919903 /DNA_START=41 /DNA_END=766 /DNA_ORIENTATION=+